MVVPVVGHVVRQGRRQLIRYGIADVIVSAVLPIARLARGIVRVLDLLLELRLLGFFVLHIAGQNAQIFISFKLQCTGRHIACQAGEDIFPGVFDFSITAQKQFGPVHATLGLVGTYLTTNFKKHDEIVEWDYRALEGRPLDVIWGYKCLGFYTYDDFDVSTTIDGNTKYTLKKTLPNPMIGGTIQPGDLKYEDVNGDSKIDANDQVNLGKSGTFGSPFTIGVNLTLKYKNFTLFMLGNGQFGAYGMMNNSYYYMSGENKYSVNARNRWTPETADVATHPRLTSLSSANNGANSTFWRYSTDRFNIRKIQLTYDFPSDMFNGKWVKALSVHLNGNDLLTISKNRKMMETSVGYAPQTRFYNLGVKVTL